MHLRRASATTTLLKFHFGIAKLQLDFSEFEHEVFWKAITVSAYALFRLPVMTRTIPQSLSSMIFSRD